MRVRVGWSCGQSYDNPSGRHSKGLDVYASQATRKKRSTRKCGDAYSEKGEVAVLQG